MFEKEAEEWAKESMDCVETDNCLNQPIPYFSEEERCIAKSAFQDGAEFGYNIAYKEMDTEKMLKVLKDRNVIKSWYYNGAYHAEATNV